MTPVPIYILAGGLSARFGSDKARAELNGEPLLQRIVRLLSPVAATFTAVADRPGKYADIHVRTIPDIHPGLGPISGLHAALKDLPLPGWLLLVSCDFVTLDPAWVAQLINASNPTLRAVAFRGEKIEPLFALYHSSLLPDVEEYIAARMLSPSKLIELEPSTLLPLPENWPSLAHINTPDELAQHSGT